MSSSRKKFSLVMGGGVISMNKILMDKDADYYDVYVREMINLIENYSKQTKILNDFISSGEDILGKERAKKLNELKHSEKEINDTLIRCEKVLGI